MEKTNVKIIAENRKARHDYAIHETFETGVVLTGTEVKSLRAGKANLKDSYAAITKSGELYLYNLHISEYDHGNIFNHEPRRDRKLLMHKREIAKLIGKTKEKGFTLVPLTLYFSHGLVKVKLALATGKNFMTSGAIWRTGRPNEKLTGPSSLVIAKGYGNIIFTTFFVQEPFDMIYLK